MNGPSDSRVRCEIRKPRRKKARGREEGSFTGVHFCHHSLTHPLQSFQLISALCCPHKKSMRAPEWCIRWGWSKVVWETKLHNKMTKKKKNYKTMTSYLCRLFQCFNLPLKLLLFFVCFFKVCSRSRVLQRKTSHDLVTLPIEDKFNSDLDNGISKYTVWYHTIL